MISRYYLIDQLNSMLNHLFDSIFVVSDNVNRRMEYDISYFQLKAAEIDTFINQVDIDTKEELEKHIIDYCRTRPVIAFILNYVALRPVSRELQTFINDELLAIGDIPDIYFADFEIFFMHYHQEITNALFTIHFDELYKILDMFKVEVVHFAENRLNTWDDLDSEVVPNICISIANQNPRCGLYENVFTTEDGDYDYNNEGFGDNYWDATREFGQNLENAILDFLQEYNYKSVQPYDLHKLCLEVTIAEYNEYKMNQQGITMWNFESISRNEVDKIYDFHFIKDKMEELYRISKLCGFESFQEEMSSVDGILTISAMFTDMYDCIHEMIATVIPEYISMLLSSMSYESTNDYADVVDWLSKIKSLLRYT